MSYRHQVICTTWRIGYWWLCNHWIWWIQRHIDVLLVTGDGFASAMSSALRITGGHCSLWRFCVSL